MGWVGLIHMYHTRGFNTHVPYTICGLILTCSLFCCPPTEKVAARLRGVRAGSSQSRWEGEGGAEAVERKEGIGEEGRAEGAEREVAGAVASANTSATAASASHIALRSSMPPMPVPGIPTMHNPVPSTPVPVPSTPSIPISIPISVPVSVPAPILIPISVPVFAPDSVPVPVSFPILVPAPILILRQICTPLALSLHFPHW
mmetsp:Transcript_1444/g.2948  ORF Transcript_1444/g.2948 Transcript_1444/m.2948 type:complete len:202 (-) Transcript_1444:815-1420(-)